MKDYTKEYKFLSKTNTVEEYVPPSYYNELLKPYVFSGKTDLEIFKEYLCNLDAPQSILELCSGSGRVTETAIDIFPNATFTLSDLSDRMLEFTKEKFADHKNMRFIQSDAVKIIGELSGQYDLIYTLWGFSHSVHQHIHEKGKRKTKKLLKHNFEKLLKNNMKKGSKFYLVHFDSMSDEQRILMRQWKRVYPTFSDIKQQSPSKRIIDDVLHKLDNTNEIILTEKHLIGDPIIYKNEKELLEIFLNFHLETYFNESSLLPTVIEDIRKEIAKYKNPDGTFSIQTGCYIYEIEKR